MKRATAYVAVFLGAALALDLTGCSHGDDAEPHEYVGPDATNPEPADEARISGYIDSLPWGQEAIDAVGKRTELADAVVRACAEFAPPTDDWQVWCEAFLIAAACRESSLQIDLVSGSGGNPPVGLLQIRFGYPVRDYDGWGPKDATERIGCAWPDFSGLSDSDWENGASSWMEFLQDVRCNIAVGAWYYFYNATGNGDPPIYIHSYCAGDGVPANLVVGMLSYVGGPGNGTFNESDPYPEPYVSRIKEYFDAMFAAVPDPHPFVLELQPNPQQYCEDAE